MNKFTQYELLSEGFWSKLGRGIAKATNIVAPELYNAYSRPYNRIKNILSDKPTKQQFNNTFTYQGKSYIPTFENITKSGNNIIMDVYQLNASNVPITTKTYRMTIDNRYNVLKVS